MTPNLLTATQALFSPHRWFKSQKSERPTRKTEHWDTPVPGYYEYIPGRGWYLVATDKDVDPNATSTEGGPVATLKPPKPKDTVRMTQPVAVKYSKVLKRNLLSPDYEMRKRYGEIKDFRGKSSTVGFFRLDDGIAWVQCWDSDGEFVPGPYKLWCIDARTDTFRHMLRKDHPDYQPSRQNSLERESNTRRRSQDSRSTKYRTSGPGTPREGPSAPSTRPNSIKGLTLSNLGSKANSRANSRRSSPKRNESIPLEEAKAALRAMAQAHAAAVTKSVGSEESVQRGRPRTRVVYSTSSTTPAFVN